MTTKTLILALVLGLHAAAAAALSHRPATALEADPNAEVPCIVIVGRRDQAE